MKDYGTVIPYTDSDDDYDTLTQNYRTSLGELANLKYEELLSAQLIIETLSKYNNYMGTTFDALQDAKAYAKQHYPELLI